MAYPRSAAPGTGKTVALTFDDGPDPSTAQILGILTHNPLKGTPSTVAALPTIIEFFKAHGYIFVAL